MANELRITLGISYANGGMTDSVPTATLPISQSSLEFQGEVISVGTSEQDLDTSNITTLGFLFLKNLDATNYVQWGPKDGGSMVALGRIQPGECALVRLDPGITLRWAANSAAVKVLAKLYAD